jgi:hypothetical protein
MAVFRGCEPTICNKCRQKRAKAIHFLLDRASRARRTELPSPRPAVLRQRLTAQGSHMQILSARHVKPEESLRLGVVSGWYSTKVSGTFVTGPHTTQEDCLSKIRELNPPPAKKKFPAAT